MSTQCWPMLARANIYPDFGLSMLAVEKVGSFPPVQGPKISDLGPKNRQKQSKNGQKLEKGQKGANMSETRPNQLIILTQHIAPILCRSLAKFLDILKFVEI